MALNRCRIAGAGGIVDGYKFNNSVSYIKRGAPVTVAYNQAKHIVIPDHVFDAYVKDLDTFYQYIGPGKFYKSRVWDEKTLVRSIFGTRKRFNAALDFMVRMTILTRDGQRYARGLRPL